MEKKSIELFNGKDLTGWRMRDPNHEHKWVAHDGILDNTGVGVDIITDTVGEIRISNDAKDFNFVSH